MTSTNVYIVLDSYKKYIPLLLKYYRTDTSKITDKDAAVLGSTMTELSDSQLDKINAVSKVNFLRIVNLSQTSNTLRRSLADGRWL